MMAPIEPPVTGAAQQAFEPQVNDFVTPEASGYVGGVQAGNPLWSGVWQLGKVGARGSDDWRSFMAELGGSKARFFARDLARPYPLLYANGFGAMTLADGETPFDGAAASWSQTATDDAGNGTLALTGPPAGLILSTGDYVGFRWDAADLDDGNMARRALVRVLRGGGGMADAEGAVTLRVTPAVPTLVVPEDAIAHLDRPACVMVQLTDKSSLGPIDRRLAVTSGTLTAIQDLRP